MAFRLIKGRRPPETLGRWAAAAGGRGSGDADMTSWENTGTQSNVLPSGVQQLGLNAGLLPPERNILTYSCPVLKPVICAGCCKAGGGHAALALGRVPTK